MAVQALFSKNKCNFWNHALCSGFEISESWWILLSGKSWCNNGFFWEVRTLCAKVLVLLMEEILHQLIGSLSHYLPGFIHPRWLFGISEPSTVGKHMPEDFCPKWFTPKYHWPWNSGLTFFVWNMFLFSKYCVWSNYSDLTQPGPPNGGLVREMGPLLSGKPRLVKY